MTLDILERLTPYLGVCQYPLVLPKDPLTLYPKVEVTLLADPSSTKEAISCATCPETERASPATSRIDLYVTTLVTIPEIASSLGAA